MKGVPFIEANKRLGAPPGKEKEVYPLHVHVTGDGRCISCWEVTPADAERMRRTHRAWLHLWSGKTMPPACVTSESPFEDEPMPSRPTVVCLCGSTRFKREYAEAGEREARAGRIVLTCQLFGHADGLDLAPGDKAALDELHLRKIDLSDEILVIDPGRYVGESTRNEIAYARANGKDVRFLSVEGPCGT